MDRRFVAHITKKETDEYSYLYERLLAFRSVRKIINSNADISRLAGFNVADKDEIIKIHNEEIKCTKAIKSWWDKIDERYVLDYDDRYVLVLDFDDCNIYSIDKN